MRQRRHGYSIRCGRVVLHRCLPSFPLHTDSLNFGALTIVAAWDRRWNCAARDWMTLALTVSDVESKKIWLGSTSYRLASVERCNSVISVCYNVTSWAMRSSLPRSIRVVVNSASKEQYPRTYHHPPRRHVLASRNLDHIHSGLGCHTL